jgi:hypothetical protein
VGKKTFTSSCDVAKSVLAKKGIPYTNAAAPTGTLATVKIGDEVIESFEGTGLEKADFTAKSKDFTGKVTAQVKTAGYPEKADPSQSNYPMLILLLAILVLYVTMVYGPIAAWLVEMFPTRIRYTSMSLPYHIGNGWFGGFVPTIGFMLVAWKGDIYYGLWYPVVVALMTVVIGLFFVRETKDVPLDH